MKMHINQFAILTTFILCNSTKPFKRIDSHKMINTRPWIKGLGFIDLDVKTIHSKKQMQNYKEIITDVLKSEEQK